MKKISKFIFTVSVYTILFASKVLAQTDYIKEDRFSYKNNPILCSDQMNYKIEFLNLDRKLYSGFRISKSKMKNNNTGVYNTI